MTGDAESFMVAGGLRPVHPPSLASVEIADGGLFIPSAWRRFIVRAAEDDAGGMAPRHRARANIFGLAFMRISASSTGRRR